MPKDKNHSSINSADPSGKGAGDDVASRAWRIRWVSEKQREANRVNFESNNFDLCKANSLTRDTFLSFHVRNVEKTVNFLVDNSYHQNSVACAFILGIGLCEESIMEGLHLQAVSLLRQEHEFVSRFQELEKESGGVKKTPHPTIGLLRQMGRSYGELSEILHVSTPEWLSEMVSFEDDKSRGPSMTPIPHEPTSRNLLFSHIRYTSLMLSLVVDKGFDLGIGGLVKEEVEQLELVHNILYNEGFLSKSYDAPSTSGDPSS